MLCINEKCFVAHVKRGYEEREKHIVSMLGKMNIPFEWMLDGDIPDFNDATDSRWFRHSRLKDSAKSCALKHLLIYEEIIKRKLPGALILEDDITLSSSFLSVFQQSMKEKEVYEGGGRGNLKVPFSSATRIHATAS
ncbi:MAG: glycosyltransferase family 25 protein [Bacteroides sp.]|nr:glycosyltransferase family 25 protein [Roseburia sp.]MCM1347747.1 glycosyltransferase family 25 protein [Bacteroides sp.]MCM1422137.1 glycosyltransferase family 25 protein [Bacteroides sp.]